MADKNFLPVYRERSYLKAAIGDPQAHVVSTEDEHVLVDVTFPVHPGKQYKVSGLEIAGCQGCTRGHLAEPDPCESRGDSQCHSA